MQYRQLVEKVQVYSGFSDSESENALRTFVRRLSARLTKDERKNFGTQLPADLQDLALTDESSDVKSQEDFIRQFSPDENIDENRKKADIRGLAGATSCSHAWTD